MEAEKLFYNGTIYTMEKPGEVYEALAVNFGRIVACGTSEEMLKINAAEKLIQEK